MFLVVAGARLWVVANFGSAMPLLDQWDDEAARIFKPYLEGTLGLSELVAPHNEHRPVVGRLLALTLLMLNGQWDARLQMLANALLAAAAAVVVAWVGTKVVSARHRTFVLAAVACWGGFPYAWENTTWAFQSSFYFLVLFSVLAIWGLIAHRAFTSGWVLGAVAALFACLSLGSGFLCGAAVLVVVLLRVLTGRATLRECVATAVVCVVTISVGLTLRVHVPDHDVLRATSLLHWMNVFARGLAWPFAQTAPTFLLTCLPIAALAVSYLRGNAALAPQNTSARAEALLAIAAWVALQAAAIAFTRGGWIYAEWMSPRYMDVLALGAVAGLLAILLLASMATPSRRVIITAAGAAWLAVIFAGAVALSYRGVRDLRARADQVRQAEADVRTYLASGDIARLTADSTHIAYPWADRFTALLNDPTIRRILPAMIRPPLVLEPDESSAGLHAQTNGDGEQIWSSARGSGEMRSRVLHSTFPLVRLALHGKLDERVALKFRDARTGRENGAAFSGSSAGWRIGHAQVSGEFRIIVRDHDAERWLEFTAPREVGRLSFYAEKLLARASYVLVAGLALAVAIAARREFRAL